MDTFAELAPAAGPDPMPPRPRTRVSQAAPPTEASLLPGRTRRLDHRANQISLDPLQATDRYRLVMPYDQRL